MSKGTKKRSLGWMALLVLGCVVLIVIDRFLQTAENHLGSRTAASYLLWSVLGFSVVVFLTYKFWRWRTRWDDLTLRFGEEGARLILAKQLWQGAPKDAVLEMFGTPHAIDEKVSKTKAVHTLKYFAKGNGRFGLRVTTEDSVVTGWETSND
jgi:uncharacterized membrane protein YeaQ/YmgE (transglycosylase-associated protein family)